MANGLVAIVDDDEAIRASTSRLLIRAGFTTNTFESGDDFLRHTDLGAFSCVLLDVQMPGSNGLAVLRHLASRGESPPVLVVTGHGDVPTAVIAMKLGAHDFIEKGCAPEDLLAGIRQVVGEGATRQAIHARRAGATSLVKTLSEREREVLQGILRGLQNKVIAFELGLSTRTVEAYRSTMLLKLGVRGTAEAVRLALTAGLGDGVSSPPRVGARSAPTRSGFRFEQR